MFRFLIAILCIFVTRADYMSNILKVTSINSAVKLPLWTLRAAHTHLPTNVDMSWRDLKQIRTYYKKNPPARMENKEDIWSVDYTLQFALKNIFIHKNINSLSIKAQKEGFAVGGELNGVHIRIKCHHVCYIFKHKDLLKQVALLRNSQLDDINLNDEETISAVENYAYIDIRGGQPIRPRNCKKCNCMKVITSYDCEMHHLLPLENEELCKEAMYDSIPFITLDTVQIPIQKAASKGGSSPDCSTDGHKIIYNTRRENAWIKELPSIGGIRQYEHVEVDSVTKKPPPGAIEAPYDKPCSIHEPCICQYDASIHAQSTHSGKRLLCTDVHDDHINRHMFAHSNPLQEKRPDKLQNAHYNNSHCSHNYHVSNHTCVECPAGYANYLKNDDVSGPDTVCIHCDANYHGNRGQNAYCSNNGIINTAGNGCEVAQFIAGTGNCTNGGTVNTVGNDCEVAQFIAGTGNCNNGGTINAVGNGCEVAQFIAGTGNCNNGGTINTAGNGCEVAQFIAGTGNCNNGGTINAAGNGCEVAQFNAGSCTNGGTINAAGNGCVDSVFTAITAPSCTNGGTVNGGVCVDSVFTAITAPSCTNGGTVNGGVCVDSVFTAITAPSCTNGGTVNGGVCVDSVFTAITAPSCTDGGTVNGGVCVDSVFNHYIAPFCEQCPTGASSYANIMLDYIQCKCDTTKYVNNNVCETCPTGYQNGTKQSVPGENTICGECAEDYKVSSGSCVACDDSAENDAGDRIIDGNSSCTTKPCHPADSIVRVQHPCDIGMCISQKRMDRINMGDMVESAPNIFEPVIAFTHRETQDNPHQYLSFAFANSSMEISYNHYMYANNKRVLPREVNVGDTFSNGEKIKSIRTVFKKGSYHIHTWSTKLVVNGVQTSTNSGWMTHFELDYIFTPVAQMLYYLNRPIDFAPDTKWKSLMGIPSHPFIQSARQYIPYIFVPGCSIVCNTLMLMFVFPEFALFGAMSIWYYKNKSK